MSHRKLGRRQKVRSCTRPFAVHCTFREAAVRRRRHLKHGARQTSTTLCPTARRRGVSNTTAVVITAMAAGAHAAPTATAVRVARGGGGEGHSKLRRHVRPSRGEGHT